MHCHAPSRRSASSGLLKRKAPERKATERLSASTQPHRLQAVRDHLPQRRSHQQVAVVVDRERPLPQQPFQHMPHLLAAVRVIPCVGVIYDACNEQLLRDGRVSARAIACGKI